MIKANTSLLLLTPRTESAVTWESNLRHIDHEFVIATYPHQFPHDLDKRFALAIVDAQGPTLSVNTLDLCRRLRKRMRNPILLLTHDTDEARLLRAYQLGVDDCIYKPIGAELLIAKVSAWLRFSEYDPNKPTSLGYLPDQ